MCFSWNVPNPNSSWRILLYFVFLLQKSFVSLIQILNVLLNKYKNWCKSLIVQCFYEMHNMQFTWLVCCSVVVCFIEAGSCCNKYGKLAFCCLKACFETPCSKVPTLWGSPGCSLHFFMEYIALNKLMIRSNLCSSYVWDKWLHVYCSSRL